MGPDLMSALVDDVMTKSPKTVARDTLASEALEMLNSSKVTALMVTEAGKPDRSLGSSGLRRLCREAPRLSLQGLLEHIERSAVERAGGSLHDDIALLALRLLTPDPARER